MAQSLVHRLASSEAAAPGRLPRDRRQTPVMTRSCRSSSGTRVGGLGRGTNPQASSSGSSSRTSHPVRPSRRASRAAVPLPGKHRSRRRNQGPRSPGQEGGALAHPSGETRGVSVLEGELDLRDVELGLVLHREPTGWGELQAGSLAVEDRQDSAVADLISRRLAGIGLGGATRKHSEVSHVRSVARRPAPAPGDCRAFGSGAITAHRVRVCRRLCRGTLEHQCASVGVGWDGMLT